MMLVRIQGVWVEWWLEVEHEYEHSVTLTTQWRLISPPDDGERVAA